MKTAYIYTRVSTAKQQRSGLGLDDQIEQCLKFCNDNQIEVLEISIETQSGKNANDRPVLQEILKKAKKENAMILVSKLCRLSRSIADISCWIREKVPFVVAEIGFDCDNFQLYWRAMASEWEREQCSKRTKAALRVARDERGVKLGASNPKIKASIVAIGAKTDERVCDWIREAQSKGITSQRKIAAYLNELGIIPPRGDQWSKSTIRMILKRMAAA